MKEYYLDRLVDMFWQLVWFLRVAPSRLYWRYRAGTTVVLPWPRLVWLDYEDTVGCSRETSDPNDHYRPWLEKHVGRQGWDWEWEYVPDWEFGATNGSLGVINKDMVIVTFRKGKEQYATLAALKWTA